MVDFFGRVGKIIEVYEFIKVMLIEFDLFVWGVFLGVCRQYGNIEFVEVVVKCLFEFEFQGAGLRFLLNLYVGVGNWVNVV